MREDWVFIRPHAEPSACMQAISCGPIDCPHSSPKRCRAACLKQLQAHAWAVMPSVACPTPLLQLTHMLKDGG